MKKVCVITATRAEYGLLKPLMQLIKESNQLQLQIIATGAHLSPEFGLTYKNIENDGFIIDEKVEILLSSDTAASIAKTMGMAMMGMADVLPRLKPDLIVILGDRYEMLSIASAATIFKIPIAHLHGGEITEGAYDDAIRHSITKMSHLHFTSTEEYKKRVIQMGENPENVFNVGAIGLDNIRDLKLLSKQELETDLDIKFKKYNYQVTFHPETLGNLSSAEQFQNLLNVIEKQEDSFFIFTKANADTDGRIINQMIDDFVKKHADIAKAFNSLGTLRFLSTVRICTAIVGNSSSGILEAPSLYTPTINIGDRQKGRTQASSIINVDNSEKSIFSGFQLVKNLIIENKISEVKNPYDNGGAAQEILNKILEFKTIKTNKSFYNLS
ncbi:UDP-N-acetylglucosamine 2-epimerase [Chryseobacterium indoltheticum]|jgi:UDP-hydrolysing UDP-N-acetyl-D-glucosamine 2-epimerase|uniref:UDP-N-acetylglucosamine 2-epimerase n=1 Tax=Chryseobacterium indoltheticum TaxID=254 RepID=UPI0024307260|nr:UDP-N-acetylglucosamine 2-epimerase [Chryseobacterium indoltheticum]MDF2832923.1 neuC [Chryseobacterium indoltheticum]